MRGDSLRASALLAMAIATTALPAVASAQEYGPLALRFHNSSPMVASGGESANVLSGRIDASERNVYLGIQSTPSRASWYAPLASLAIPGAGQTILGQQRGVAYAVLDAYLLVQAASAQRAGKRERSSYRRLAADVARSPFGGAKPDGSWPYYEAMEQFLESGRYSVDAGRLEPETDISTFNGAQWQLARETFWRDPDAAPPPSSPEYQRALEFYEKRAIRDEFRWSWRDAQLQQGVYRQTIIRSNRNYQRAVNFAGMVAANHLLSMVDAYATVRLRRYTTGAEHHGPGLETGLALGDPTHGGTMETRIKLTLPFR